MKDVEVRNDYKDNLKHAHCRSHVSMSDALSYLFSKKQHLNSEH